MIEVTNNKECLEALKKSKKGETILFNEKIKNFQWLRDLDKKDFVFFMENKNKQWVDLINKITKQERAKVLEEVREKFCLKINGKSDCNTRKYPCNNCFKLRQLSGGKIE